MVQYTVKSLSTMRRHVFWLSYKQSNLEAEAKQQLLGMLFASG